MKEKTLRESKKYGNVKSGDLFVKDLLKINPITFLIDEERKEK